METKIISTKKKPYKPWLELGVLDIHWTKLKSQRTEQEKKSVDEKEVSR